MAVKVAELESELRLNTAGFTQALTKAEARVGEFSKDIVKQNAGIKRSFTSLSKQLNDVGNEMSAAFEKTLVSFVATGNAVDSISRSYVEAGRNIKDTMTTLGKMSGQSLIKPLSEETLKSYDHLKKRIEEISKETSELKDTTQKSHTAIRRTLKTSIESFDAFSEAAKKSFDVITVGLKDVTKASNSFGTTMSKNLKKAATSLKLFGEAYTDVGKSIRTATESTKKATQEVKKQIDQLEASGMERLKQDAARVEQTTKRTARSLEEIRAKLRESVKAEEQVRQKVEQKAQAQERAANATERQARATERQQRLLNSGAQQAQLNAPGGGSGASSKRWQPGPDFTGFVRQGKSSSDIFKNMKKGWADVSEASLDFSDNLATARAKMDALGASAKKAYHPVMNIFQGIVLAQGFYRVVNAIQDTIGGMWEMAKAAETTTASFNVMLKDAEASVALTEYLKDFAAQSTFTFETASKSAKQLLAYGFQLENVGYLLTTIGDAAAAMDNPEAFTSIAKALGQIQTRGKLATQEILQLTEAGIPAYQILQEELGLTGQEMSNVARLGIKSNDAIEALVNGINKRYGGAMKELNKTLPGLWNNIQETLANVGAEGMKKLYANTKEIFGRMSETLETWQKVIRSSGLGGLFEHIFPPEMHATIRQFVANLDALRVTFMNLYYHAKPFIDAIGGAFIQVMNLVLPIIQFAVLAFSKFFQVLAKNEIAIRLVTAAAVGFMVFTTVYKVMTAVIKAGSALSSGLGAMSAAFIVTAQRSGILMASIGALKSVLTGGAGIAAMVASIAALGAGMAAVTGMFQPMTDGLGKIFGKHGDNYLQPEFNDLADAGYDFNKTLEDTNEKLDDTGDAMDSAAKKAKKAKDQLMAFDEVFTLDDPVDDAGGAGGGWDENFELPEIFDPGALPDFGGEDLGFGDMFEGIDNLWTKFKGKLKGWWETIKEYLEPEPWRKWAAEGGPFASMFTGIADILEGFPMLFDGIAEAIAGVIMLDPEMIANGYQRAVDSANQILKGLVTSLMGIFEGIILWIDSVFTKWWGQSWENLKKDFDLFGQGIGTAWEGLKQVFMGMIDFLSGVLSFDWQQVWQGWVSIFDGFKGIIDGLVEAVVGIFAGLLNWLDGVFTGWWGDSWEAIKGSFEGFTEGIRGLVDGLIRIVKGITEFIVGVFTLDWDRAWNGIKEIWKGFVDAVAAILDGLKTDFLNYINWTTTWFSEKWAAAWGWCKEKFNGFVEWIGVKWDDIKTYGSQIISWISGGFANAWSTAWEGIKSIFSGIFDSLIGIAKAPLNAIIKLINGMIGGMNKVGGLVSKLPDVNVPTIPDVPYLAKGGLVTRQTMAVMGEGGRQEAVVPLENPATMSRLGRAIADNINPQAGNAPTTGTDTSGGSSVSGEITLNIGTLVADDRGLRELERKLQAFRQQENGRRFG